MGLYEGKSVIVTGAGKSGSLPYGIARAFAREGAGLFMTGKSRSKVSGDEKLADFGRDAVFHVVDATCEDEVHRAVELALDRFGRIDVLVNAEKFAKVGVPLVDLSADDLKLACDMSLIACLTWMKACYPHLSKTHGSVVNILAGSYAGATGFGALVAVNEGIRGLSREAAKEWAALGIRVNMVSALAKTWQESQWAKEFPDAHERLVTSIPMGCLGDAEDDVGRTCVYLGSDAARLVTGQCLHVDGGTHLAI